MSDLAFHLAEAGFDVQVLTSRQIYDEHTRVLRAGEHARRRGQPSVVDTLWAQVTSAKSHRLPDRNSWSALRGTSAARTTSPPTLLDAAAALRDLPDIHFLLVGAGTQRAWVEARVADLGLTNISFQPYQPLDRLALSLSVPYLHLVFLKPELEGLIVPRKFYSVLAPGRPVHFVGDPQAETARCIDEADWGRSFPPGAHTDLMAAIRHLASHPTQVTKIGEHAHDLWAARFQRKQALEKWQAAVTQLSAGTKE